MYNLYVWLTPNGDYYHKVCKGTYIYNKVGCVNQYNHKLVHIINLSDFLTKKNYKVSYRRMLINDTIRLLNRIK